MYPIATKDTMVIVENDQLPIIPSKSLEFNDKSIRAAFIRKVFALVTVMLCMVAAITSIPFFVPSVKEHFRHNRWWLVGSIALFIALYLPLLCIKSLTRTFPINLLLTGVLTLSMGFVAMTACAYFDIVIVLIALLVTAVSCATIIIFTLQTKFDLTSWAGHAIVALISLILIGAAVILLIFVFSIKYLYVIVAIIAAVILMVVLSIDVERMMSGKRGSGDMSPEDYIPAAVQLFLDIMLVFFLILLVVALLAGGGKGCNDCNAGGGPHFFPNFGLYYWLCLERERSESRSEVTPVQRA
ncbi:inhibitor of apoptosis-promoting bax1 domain-containing protein [Ditylenchus destructor]|uniref:Inhibitor of apoptosis-promoting bax1 domain-containing protein n=1 Tax=Ditylenchus destructor TaxID=166010 RepID=A0AAD4MU78_9BILA|nr:inhibitor of apoptosis-promoting bax1 domain-containing protein [Ditylenchus destructor]